MSAWSLRIIEPSQVPGGEAGGERGDARVAAPPVLPQRASLRPVEDQPDHVPAALVGQVQGTAYVGRIGVLLLGFRPPLVADGSSTNVSASRLRYGSEVKLGSLQRTDQGAPGIEICGPAGLAPYRACMSATTSGSGSATRSEVLTHLHEETLGSPGNHMIRTWSGSLARFA